jgi:heterodisulfide reductase subunit A-like polyferredoxin
MTDKKKRAKEERVGVYVCHCGTNIAGTVDCKAVTEYAGSLEDVVVSRDTVYTCSEPGQNQIAEDIKKLGLTKVVVASCSPKMHEKTFRKTLEDAGLNPYMLEMVNLREQCSWVHKDKVEATVKAKDLVRSRSNLPRCQCPRTPSWSVGASPVSPPRCSWPTPASRSTSSRGAHQSVEGWRS